MPDDGCALRVGDASRTWTEGEVLVFDDTAEHEAWNRSDRTRTVLLFDFLRPGDEKSAPDEAPPEVREFLRQRTGRHLAPPDPEPGVHTVSATATLN